MSIAALSAGGGGVSRDGRLKVKIWLRMSEEEFVLWGVNSVPDSHLFSSSFIKKLRV